MMAGTCRIIIDMILASRQPPKVKFWTHNLKFKFPASLKTQLSSISCFSPKVMSMGKCQSAVILYFIKFHFICFYFFLSNDVCVRFFLSGAWIDFLEVCFLNPPWDLIK